MQHVGLVPAQPYSRQLPKYIQMAIWQADTACSSGTASKTATRQHEHMQGHMHHAFPSPHTCAAAAWRLFFSDLPNTPEAQKGGCHAAVGPMKRMGCDVELIAMPWAIITCIMRVYTSPGCRAKRPCDNTIRRILPVHLVC